VAEALRRLGAPDPSTTIMVGDRQHDVVGARQNGLRCIGAAWGYGGRPELEAAGATTIAADPGQLSAVLVSMIEGTDA
jgi:phosphoglycolate phosphatase